MKNLDIILSCGGIVFFHEGIPEELKLNSKNQIKYDKRDISKHKNFKIDILSNRGISQLMGICGTILILLIVLLIKKHMIF